MLAVVLCAGAVVLSVTVNVVDSRYVTHTFHSLSARKTVATWEEANTTCHSEGATLASPTDAELFMHMKTIIGINNHTTAFFIGIRARHEFGHPIQFVSQEGIPVDEMPNDFLNIIEKLDPIEGDCLCMTRLNVLVVPCTSRLPYFCYKNVTKHSNKDTTYSTTDIGTSSTTQSTTEYYEVNVTTDDTNNGLGGACHFPQRWMGGWFQSGYFGLFYINSTAIRGKGVCVETSMNKFLLYEKNEDCYKCLMIQEKHKNVLQYQETYCMERESLESMCSLISGDAPLYSMFRREPAPDAQQCPFHPPPFTFTYNRGSGECASPRSRAVASTQDSRKLLLQYEVCPDVPATDNNVEELTCLATWREGTTRYFVGLISPPQRRNFSYPDEDMYRCFVYERRAVAGAPVSYLVAQSADAACAGLTSPAPVQGARTMTLTSSM